MFRFILCGFAAIFVGFVGGRAFLAQKPVQVSSGSSIMQPRPSPRSARAPSPSADEVATELPSPASAPRPPLRIPVADAPASPAPGSARVKTTPAVTKTEPKKQRRTADRAAAAPPLVKKAHAFVTAGKRDKQRQRLARVLDRDDDDDEC